MGGAKNRRAWRTALWVIVAALVLNECLKQIKLHISLHMCAHISKLPANISTMAIEDIPATFVVEL